MDQNVETKILSVYWTLIKSHRKNYLLPYSKMSSENVISSQFQISHQAKHWMLLFLLFGSFLTNAFVQFTLKEFIMLAWQHIHKISGFKATKLKTALELLYALLTFHALFF